MKNVRKFDEIEIYLENKTYHKDDITKYKGSDSLQIKTVIMFPKTTKSKLFFKNEKLILSVTKSIRKYLRTLITNNLEEDSKMKKFRTEEGMLLLRNSNSTFVYEFHGELYRSETEK